MMAKLTEMREKLISKKKDNKGFTLVELIVVIVILAILVGVTIGGVYGYVAKSRNNTDINNASAIASAMAPLTTMKGVTVKSDTATISAKTTFDGTDADWTALGLACSVDTNKGKIKEMFPQGIEAPKTDGCSYLITYTKDTNNYVTSVMVQAVKGGTPLEAQE